MRYYEHLPPDCPPEDAAEINEPTRLYRLVEILPPTTRDFKSYRTLRPDDDFGEDECKANGLSVFSRRSRAENLCRSKNYNGYYVCELNLSTGAGKLQKSGGTHHTWWPYADYLVSTDAGTVQL